MSRMITFQDVQRLLPSDRVATNITDTSFDVENGRIGRETLSLLNSKKE